MTRATNRTGRLRERTGGLLIVGLILALIGMLSGGTAAAAGTPVGVAKPAKYKPAEQAVGLTYEGGPSHKGPVYAGTWKNGALGFCIDFSLPAPNNAGTTKLTGALPHMDAEKSAQVKHIANDNADTKSTHRAAQAQLAIWTLEGDPDFTKWYHDSAVEQADRKEVDAILAEARQHGPYTMSLTAKKVQVGQEGAGVVTVLATDGKAAAGRSVALTSTGGKILSVKKIAGHKGTTTRSGLPFAYERSQTGKVALKAVLSAPSALLAGLSTTEPGHQRTLSGGYLQSATAAYDYDLTAGMPTISSGCGTDCQGIASVAIKMCNPSKAQAIKWTHSAGGKTVSTLSALGGACASKTVKVADGRTLAASYCYTKTLGGGCATEQVKTAGSYEVVCPEWAKVIYELGCDCDAAGAGTVTFMAPAASSRFYRGFLTVTKNGATTTRPVDLVNGQPAKLDIGTMPDGGQVAVSFTAYRDAGRLTELGGNHVLRRVTISPPA